MEEKIVFFNDEYSDLEFDSSNLILNSIMLIEKYYLEHAENNIELIYKEGEDLHHLPTFLFFSKQWLADKIDLFKKLLFREIDRVEISIDDFKLIKYYVDFSWYNSSDIQMLFSQESYQNIEQKSKRRKKATLYVVK